VRLPVERLLALARVARNAGDHEACLRNCQRAADALGKPPKSYCPGTYPWWGRYYETQHEIAAIIQSLPPVFPGCELPICKCQSGEGWRLIHVSCFGTWALARCTGCERRIVMRPHEFQVTL
jgi:hypothetical protein